MRMTSLKNAFMELIINIIVTVISTVYLSFHLKVWGKGKARLFIAAACIFGSLMAMDNIPWHWAAGVVFAIVVSLLVPQWAFDGKPTKKLLVSSVPPITVAYALMISYIILPLFGYGLNVGYEFTIYSDIPFAVSFLVIYCILMLANTRLFTIEDRYPKRIYFMLIGVNLLSLTAVAAMVALYKENHPEYVGETMRYTLLSVSLVVFLFFNIAMMFFVGAQNRKYTEYALELQKQEFAKEMTVKSDRIRHDYKKHIDVMLVMVKEKKYGDLANYMEELSNNYTRDVIHRYTDNDLLNAMLAMKMQELKKLGIKLELHVKLTHTIPLPDTELTALISNMLDNAIEACEKIPDHDARYIAFTIEDALDMDMIRIEVKNSSNGIYTYKNGLLVSGKEDGLHGIGLGQINQIAENTKGFVNIQPLESQFTVTVMLPVNRNINQ